MRTTLLSVLLAATTAFGGTLSITSITDPLGGSSTTGSHSGFGDGISLGWTNFTATANSGAGTIVTTGILRCPDMGGCGGGTPARFRVDFTGSNFSTVGIDFQGILTSLVLPPDDRGILYGSVNTVVFTGTPTYVGNQLQEIGPNQILSQTSAFGFDAPTAGKVLISSHEPAGTIPAGAFYGYTVLRIESLTGQLDFSDPLTNQFAEGSAVPEPATLAGVAMGILAVLLVRNRLA